MTPALVFDAAQTLGLNNGSTKPKRSQQVLELPAPTEDYLTLRIPKGLTLEDVRTSPVGREELKHQEWYLNKPWYRMPIPAGIWLFRLMPDSRGKNSLEVRGLMAEQENFPHVALGTAAVLCLRQRRIDPLNGLFLTVNPDSNQYVIQLASPGRYLEIITYRDQPDAHTIAAAAKPAR